MLGESDPSLKAARQSVAIAPMSANSLGALASRLADYGELEEAKDALSRALKQEPANGWLHIRLAELTRYDEVTPHVELMESLLKRPNISVMDQAGIYFALAKVHDDLGDVGKAFGYLKRGNDLFRRQQPFDLGAYETACVQIIELFSKSFMQSHAGQSCSSEQPIFVVGLPRSGTTLIEQILLSLEDVGSIGEQDNLRFSVWHAFEKCVGQGSFPKDISKLESVDWKFHADNYLESTNHITSNRLINKALENTLYMGIIATVFSNAKIIYCRRNIIDTCFSIYQRSFSNGAVPYGYDIEELAAFCRLQKKLLDHWRLVMADRFMEIRYEDLVDDPPANGLRLVEYCDLPWNPKCLDFYTSRRTVLTSSRHQVRQPIYRTSVERWRKYEPFLAPLIEELGDLVPS